MCIHKYITFVKLSVISRVALLINRFTGSSLSHARPSSTRASFDAVPRLAACCRPKQQAPTQHTSTNKPRTG